MTCLMSSLAGPVRGIRLTKPGKADSSRYGAAIPAPIAAKVLRVITGDCVVAHAAAAPMNGAVHGVDSTAVMIPKPNEPPRDSSDGLMRQIHPGSLTEKRRHMPTANTQITRPTAMVKAGNWNNLFVESKPLTVVIAAARASQKATTPKDMKSPSRKLRRRFPPALERLMILMGTRGNTQGVKFNNTPPTAATKHRIQIRDGSNTKFKPKRDTSKRLLDARMVAKISALICDG